MTSRERAREVAAQVWCEPCFAHISMDVSSAERIAEKIDAVAQEAAAQMRERAAYLVGWFESDGFGSIVNQKDKAKAIIHLEGIETAIRALPLTEEVTR